MRSGHDRFGLAILATVALGLLVVGCSTGPGPLPGPGSPFSPVKMTGGGWLPSAAGLPAKANFGFNASHCTPTSFSGHFNYHDKHAPNYQPGGVKMNGAVVSATQCIGADCPSGCPKDSFEAVVEYRSTNPRFPGTGTARACVEDNGEGSHAQSDRALITVVDGPFAPPPPSTLPPYSNRGDVQGNIQFHTCTCNDGDDNDGDGFTDGDDPACLDPVTQEFDPSRDEE